MLNRREFLVAAAGSGMAATAIAQITQLGEGHRRRDLGSAIPSIKAVRRDETLLRLGGHGDAWHMSWAVDNRQYVSMAVGAGFSPNPTVVHYSRMLALSGDPRSARFDDLPGYPAQPMVNGKEPNYIPYGTLALNGKLYQFLSTYNRPFRSDEAATVDPNDLVLWQGVKLIYSPDNGRTWNNQDGSTPVVWEPYGHRSRKNMLFFEEDDHTFSFLSVLQMGRNYEHNRDGYIYVYSPNGMNDGTMNELVMFRVKKERIVEREAYEFFAGLDSLGNAIWNRGIGARKPVHTFPRGWVNKLLHAYSWQPSVAYNSALGLYMMANWGTATGTGTDRDLGATADDMWFVRPSYLGFWVAHDPWGPWHQIHEETTWMPGGDTQARCFQAQIAPKWIADDGRSFWLVWTDFQMTDGPAFKRMLLTDPGSWSWSRFVMASRKYQPYFSFNVQRVDLNVT